MWTAPVLIFSAALIVALRRSLVVYAPGGRSGRPVELLSWPVERRWVCVRARGRLGRRHRHGPGWPGWWRGGALAFPHPQFGRAGGGDIPAEYSGGLSTRPNRARQYLRSGDREQQRHQPRARRCPAGAVVERPKSPIPPSSASTCRSWARHYRFSHEKLGQATDLTVLVASNGWPERKTAHAHASNLRAAAIKANFLGLPRSTRCW